LALLNVLLPGVAQIVFGQIAKGILMLLLHFVTFATVVIPLIIIVLSVIDGYKVGSKLRRTGAVGPWEFFPA
jgi:TM2 domain-containing membrane protein YozV